MADATTRISVRLTPRAGRDAIEGWEGETLRVRVAAPPADGRANEALVRLLATALEVPKASITMAGGSRSRDKLVDIESMSRADVIERLRAVRPV